MFGFGTFHIIFVLVLLAVVVLVRISMNKANKNGSFPSNNNLIFENDPDLDPSESWSGTNINGEH
jgi:hypothetical protein